MWAARREQFLYQRPEGADSQQTVDGRSIYVQTAHTFGGRVHERDCLWIAGSWILRVPFEARKAISEVVASERHFYSVEIVPVCVCVMGRWWWGTQSMRTIELYGSV